MSKAYRENFAGIDWSRTPEWRPERRRADTGNAPYFVPDIAEFRSPLDGKMIGSRSSLRDHERAHGVRQCGELKSASDFDNRVHKPFEPVLERMLDRHGLHRRG